MFMIQGASRWLGFLMVIWGLLSACTMFVDSAKQYYVLRFILGAAEAGFFPWSNLLFVRMVSFI